MSSLPESERVENCQECGAIIYKEHVDRRLAGRWAGKLLCPQCFAEKKKTDEPALSSGEDLEPLSLVDEPDAGDSAGRSSIMGGSGFGSTAPGASETQPFHRPLNQAGQGATRIRTFHAKLGEGSIRHLDQQVNAWLDGNPEIEIKFATTTVGVWEGKHSEPCLILTIFY